MRKFKPIKISGYTVLSALLIHPLPTGDRPGQEAELPREVGSTDQAVHGGTQRHVPIGWKEPTELHHRPGQWVWPT